MASKKDKQQVGRVFQWSAAQRKAMELLVREEKTKEELAAEIGVSARTLYTWRQKFAKIFLDNNPQFLKLYTDRVRKAMAVMDRAMAGEDVKKYEFLAAKGFLESARVWFRGGGGGTDVQMNKYNSLFYNPGNGDPEDQDDEPEINAAADRVNKALEVEYHEIPSNPQPDDGFAAVVRSFSERVQRLSQDARGEKGTDS